MKVKSLLSLLTLAGCMSADPDYYTLYPIANSASAGASFAAVQATVKIQRPGLDSLLDRPEMVEMQSQSRVSRDTARLWAEPLDKMAERVLALDLGQRLPASAVITESGGMQADYTYRVEWELQHFGTDEDGKAQLMAQLLIVGPGEEGTPQPVMLKGSKASSGKALAQALSELLARLSDKAATEIQARQIVAVPKETPGGSLPTGQIPLELSPTASLIPKAL